MKEIQLEQCIHEYGKDIYALCSRLAQNTQEAEDLYQDTFLKVVELGDKIDYEQNPKSYIVSITLRIWKNRKRKYAWRKRIAGMEQLTEEAVCSEADGQGTSVEEEFLRKERQEQVKEAVAGLEDRYRIPVYGEEPFFVSPLIKGQDPAWYNIMTMHGGYSEIVQDGVQYRITESDNVEIFADRTLYLAVSSGTFYDGNAYVFDDNTGEITRNEYYEGVNALFYLPIDVAKADKEKADAYLQQLEQELSGEEGSLSDTEGSSFLILQKHHKRSRKNHQISYDTHIVRQFIKK